MDELTISVTIADRPYRLKIKRDEEETVRNAANEINSKLKSYAENFAFNDKQDLLAMVTLEKTTESLMMKNSLNMNEKEISSKLVEIDNLLSENSLKN